MFRLIPVLIAILFLLPSANAQETEITFTASSGESVTAYEGWFEVPENRADPA